VPAGIVLGLADLLLRLAQYRAQTVHSGHRPAPRPRVDQRPERGEHRAQGAAVDRKYPDRPVRQRGHHPQQHPAQPPGHPLVTPVDVDRQVAGAEERNHHGEIGTRYRARVADAHHHRATRRGVHAQFPLPRGPRVQRAAEPAGDQVGRRPPHPLGQFALPRRGRLGRGHAGPQPRERGLGRLGMRGRLTM
jgi:hypothetical protein